MILLILLLNILVFANPEYCDSIDNIDECGSHQYFSNKRYILYDVNPPEGFNLRRDVYVRVAVALKKWIKKYPEYDWRLVLPPWGNLYHWRSLDVGEQVRLPWSLFFDISSLNKYIPVLEMHKFLKEYPTTREKNTEIDQVYILQNDEEMFRTGIFVNKNKVLPCSPQTYNKISDNKYSGFFWGYHNITARNVDCDIFHGAASELKTNLKPPLYRSVMFDHMEVALHDNYGSREYWKARRSMRYNSELYRIANKFRKEYLNSDDVDDNTKRVNDWTWEKSRRDATGGPYISVHLRRRDFLIGRSKTVPSLESAALQLRKKLLTLKLDTVFVATDAQEDEFRHLQTLLKEFKVLKYIPTKDVKEKFKDGGIAIIDQIIASHARYFLGTHESTFSFRIQEDREIIGFPSESTFNRLCSDKENNCSPPSKWEIVW